MTDDIMKSLKAMGACAEGMAWAATQPDWETAWANCDNPGWMCFIIDLRLEERRRMELSAKLAMDTPLGDGRTVWDIMPEVGRECLRAIRRYLDGVIDRAALDEAARAAWAARAAGVAGAVWTAARATNAAWATWAERATWAEVKHWQCDTIRERVKAEEVKP